jgi:hypothetical protein
MKSLKFVINTKSLLKLVDASTICAHFEVQQTNALEAGKISRRIPHRRLQTYAEECHASLRSQIRQCVSPKDAAVLYNNLEKQIGPHRLGFLGAAWRGDRRSTLKALNGG